MPIGTLHPPAMLDDGTPCSGLPTMVEEDDGKWVLSMDLKFCQQDADKWKCLREVGCELGRNPPSVRRDRSAGGSIGRRPWRPTPSEDTADGGGDMLTERYGLAVSTTVAAARDAYIEGVDVLLTVYPGAASSFERAIAADPGFALAHIGRSRAFQLAGNLAAMRWSLATALSLSDGGSARAAHSFHYLRN